jgi:ketosteroid isomerase-like protein
MWRSKVAAASLVGGLLLSGCGNGGAQQPKAYPMGGDAAAQITAEEEQWNREYAAHDLDRLVGHYAPDATVKLAGSPPLSGGWIRTSLAAGVNDPAFAMTFAHDRIEVARSGELAYSRGHYQLTVTDRRTRQPVIEYGTYLTVWQKQPDGRWKVLEDFTTPGPAPRPRM